MQSEHPEAPAFCTFLVLLVLVVLGGCASRPVNERITKADPRAGESEDFQALTA